jgi:hypothetical protein
MSDGDPGAGGHLPPDRPGAEFPPGEARLTGNAYPPRAGAGAQPPGPRRRRRSHSRLWISLGVGTALLVALVVIISAVALHDPGSGVPPGTPTTAQLARVLPPSKALPAGWYLVYANNDGSPYFQPGSAPPRPITACYDFSAGTDLGLAGDTFTSLAAETAQYGAGSGFLRIVLFSVLPGAGAAAIQAVRDWVPRCSSYTVNDISYSVTAAAVPGLGDESLSLHVKQLTGFAPFSSNDTDTLVVRVGNDLVVILCKAPPQQQITSLASLATPIIKKIPSASTLPTSAPPGPEALPAPSPNLTVGQLKRLLPVHAGLPAEYYQGQPPLSAVSDSNVGQFNYPLVRPPATLSCNQIPQLQGYGSLTEFDVNFRNVAYLDVYDLNSNAMDVVIDEPSTMALADADFSAVKEAAARCPTLSYNSHGLITTYRTVVTSVPGLGNENINIQMTPTASNISGEISGLQDVLLVRVGGALVMVDYSLVVPGQVVPSVAAIARPVVGGL